MITMISTYVFIGSDDDLPNLKTSPPILHAAKEPWHRKFLGYITPGAPKENPEYYVSVRHYYNECALNLVDSPDVNYIPKEVIDAGVNFVNFHRAKAKKVFIHCNKGLSRAPTIAMLVMAPSFPKDFEEALEHFKYIFPEYEPGQGMLDFAKANWAFYHGDDNAKN